MKDIQSLVVLIFVIGICISGCTLLRESASPTVTKQKFAFVYGPKNHAMEYECLDSHTGQCFFLVRDSGCKRTTFFLIYREKVCGDVQHKLTLSIGEKITTPLEYKDFSICASEKGIPEMPECLKTMEKPPYSKENHFGRVTMVFPHLEPM